MGKVRDRVSRTSRNLTESAHSFAVDSDGHPVLQAARVDAFEGQKDNETEDEYANRLPGLTPHWITATGTIEDADYDSKTLALKITQKVVRHSRNKINRD